ncbi:MAG: hypothetical protein JWO78_1394 [Micavibrio sp.]|nr:hypothetical protein [Micavibrio sp.]
MDQAKVLQPYEVCSDTVTNAKHDLTASFKAAGRVHSYFYGYDKTTDRHVLVISGRDASLEQATKEGTILPLDKNEDAFKRVLLIERGIVGGLPSEDAIRLSSGYRDYASLDRDLGEGPP